MNSLLCLLLSSLTALSLGFSCLASTSVECARCVKYTRKYVIMRALAVVSVIQLNMWWMHLHVLLQICLIRLNCVLVPGPAISLLQDSSWTESMGDCKFSEQVIHIFTISTGIFSYTQLCPTSRSWRIRECLHRVISKEIEISSNRQNVPNWPEIRETLLSWTQILQHAPVEAPNFDSVYHAIMP